MPFKALSCLMVGSRVRLPLPITDMTTGQPSALGHNSAPCSQRGVLHKGLSSHPDRRKLAKMRRVRCPGASAKLNAKQVSSGGFMAANSVRGVSVVCRSACVCLCVWCRACLRGSRCCRLITVRRPHTRERDRETLLDRHPRKANRWMHLCVYVCDCHTVQCFPLPATKTTKPSSRYGAVSSRT